jgi:hypothetical protein
VAVRKGNLVEIAAVKGVKIENDSSNLPVSKRVDPISAVISAKSGSDPVDRFCCSVMMFAGCRQHPRKGVQQEAEESVLQPSPS